MDTRVTGAFGILMYHRVTPGISGEPFPAHNVTPQRFRQQLRGLIRQGFAPWPLRKVLQHWHARREIPRKTFVVTFDDGYANNYHHAWPVLKDLQVPATIFISTAYLDSREPFPFEDWAPAGSSRVPAESWLPLTTEQCGEMASDGLIELGTHTHTHADLRGRPDTLQAELRKSQEVLRSRFGLEEATFAFPYGRRRAGFAGPQLAKAARQAGVRCALTTESELVTLGSDPFDWGRFTAAQIDTPATLASKLAGWYSLARDAWRRTHKILGSGTRAIRRSRPRPDCHCAAP